MNAPRVLHLIKPEEEHPELFERAALSVHLLPAGQPADASAREFGPMVVTIQEPFDTGARAAVEAVSELALPVIGLGGETADFLTAVASPQIDAADFATILDLAQSLHSCRYPVGTGSEHDAELSRSTESVVQLLEHIQDLRVPGYRERAQLIFDTCLWIGNHLCLAPADLKELLWAARVREIGKLGLPDRILFSHRNQRSREEQNIYDQYTSLGAKVLQNFPALRGTAKIVAHHLENFDGSGSGHLMAQQIPLGSRILRVAAAFYMIVADTQGKATTAEVLETLDRGRGSLFDPLLVRLVGNYHALAHASAGTKSSHPVKLSDLEPGMVLAEDVWSRNGMKVVARGTMLSPHTLRILLQYPLDASMETVEIRD